MVRIGPRGKTLRGVQHMTDRVNDKRPRGIVGECHEAFQAQQFRSVRVQQKVEEEGQRRWRERRLADQRDGADGVAVAITVVTMATNRGARDAARPEEAPREPPRHRERARPSPRHRHDTGGAHAY